MEHFANLDTRYVGRDRVKLAAEITRRLRLDFPHVHVGRTAAEENVDQGLVRIGRAGLRLSPVDVGQRQLSGPERERADLEKAASRNAVAITNLLPQDGQHG